MNEEETIGICLKKIHHVFNQYKITGEIIVSDNSSDKTPFIAQNHGARVISSNTLGYGAAYLYAFKHANGKYIVMGDSDDTYDFLELPTLLEPLTSDKADMVIGSRFQGTIHDGAMPWLHRWIGNPVLTWLLDVFFKAGVSDAHSGFRAIRRDALDRLELQSHGMEFASEMIIEAVQKRLRIMEVPIAYYRRINGGAKLSTFSDGWRHLKFMLLKAPNHLFVYPSIFLLCTGVFLMLVTLLQAYLGWPLSTSTLFAGSLILIIGYQTLFFGLFAKIRYREVLPSFFTLERGATIGTITFLVGCGYTALVIFRWISSGYADPLLVEQEIIGFTLIILGLQTFFSSFMLSLLADR
jgi:glycosyltransferase involved in cell wall biosynthesis